MSNNNNNNNFEDKILDAVESIVDEKISKAQYDKTISATIVECVDPTIGQFKVKYQDAVFVAYATNSSVSFSKGTDVWVLVPGNNFDREKTILGAVAKLGVNYAEVLDERDKYIANGENVLNYHLPAELASYREGRYEMTLYDVDETDNAITIDKNAMNLYLKDKNSSHIIIGCEAMTKLEQEQQVTDKGNYGLIITLDYLDNTLNKEVSRTFIFDTYNFIGNPYKQLKYTYQSAVYKHDAVNFRRIRSIKAFTEGFPFSKPEMELITDIWLRNIEICAAYEIDQEDLNNYSLTFVTKKGRFFDERNVPKDTLPILAQVRVKGQVVNTKLQDLEFYWGYERTDINYTHPLRNSYLNSYWYCMNDYNLVKGTEENPEIVSWVPAKDTIDIRFEDCKTREKLHKCVAVFTDPATGTKTQIQREFTIYNLTSNLDITIESDMGTQFYFDMGKPTLTCRISEQLRDEYTYIWSKIEGDYDNQKDLPETPDLNKEYNDTFKNYTTLYEAIEKGIKLEKDIYQGTVTNEQQLTIWKEILDNYETTERIEKYWAHKRNMSTVVSYVTYKCSVFDGELYLGTGRIGLNNTLQTEGAYRIVMHNRTILYKYDANGVAPTIRTGDNNKEPIVIKALNFTIYDNLGNSIDDEVTKHCHIEWEVPNKNTMLTHEYTEPIAVDETYGTQTFQNLMSFNYGILDYYDPYKLNNTIILRVNYKGESLVATTDFHFCKDGDPGTNGTEYTLLLVPNVVLRASAAEDKKYGVYSTQTPIITQNGENVANWTVNYKDRMLPADWRDKKLLKAMFFHNEQCIFSGTQSGLSDENIQCKLEWSMLTNKYTNNSKDPSFYLIDEKTGVINFTGYKATPAINGNNAHYANIVKLKFTYEITKFPRNTPGNQHLVNYQTMPLYTVQNIDQKYRIKDVTGGFRYVTYTEDANNPQYSDTNPFGIKIEYMADTDWNDISTNTTSNGVSFTDNWKYCGTLWNYTTKKWDNDVNLFDDKIKNKSDQYKDTRERQHNEWYVKPGDRDECQGVSNAIEVFVKKGNSIVSKIHMPVHFRIIRYGHQWINDWDGNNVNIDNEGGFILAPKVGAGKKETDNSFTGVVIGHVCEKDGFDKVGLFGYWYGHRTIFLDSESGKAEFGMAGDKQGQIIIDPQKNRAMIYSGDYKLGDLNPDTAKNGGKGLMIDFSEPYIQYGNRNFSVDKNGWLTAKGGGSIGGWQIDDYCIWQNAVGISSYNGPRNWGEWKDETISVSKPFSDGYPIDDPNNEQARTYQLTKWKPGTLAGNEITNYKAFWAGIQGKPGGVDNRGDLNSEGHKGFNNVKHKITTYGMLDQYAYENYANEPRFWVDFAGRFRAFSGKIGDSGNGMEITLGHSSNTDKAYKEIFGSNAIATAIYSRNHDHLNSKDNGFYLGDDGISIGKHFKVDADGNLTCSGEISFGGISENSLALFDFTKNIKTLFSVNSGRAYINSNAPEPVKNNSFQITNVGKNFLNGDECSQQITLDLSNPLPISLIRAPLFVDISFCWQTSDIEVATDVTVRNPSSTGSGGSGDSSHRHSIGDPTVTVTKTKFQILDGFYSTVNWHDMFFLGFFQGRQSKHLLNRAVLQNATPRPLYNKPSSGKFFGNGW